MGDGFFEKFLRGATRGVISYVKADIISSLINTVIIILGLSYGGVPWYGLIGFLIGFVDLLPIVGAGLILIPWAIIVLIMGNLSLAGTLFLIYLATLVVNQIVQPLIMGKKMGLKPIYTLLITIGSIAVLGPVMGAFVGVLISILLAVFLDIKQEGEISYFKSFKRDWKDSFNDEDLIDL